MNEAELFHNVVRNRRSIRSFLSDPVPDEVINEVLEDAQLAPSNCNVQPWNVHIVSGAKRDALSDALIAANEAGNETPDFPWAIPNLFGIYAQRAKDQGRDYYEAIGVPRDAIEDRRTASQRNLEFFGAPHVALLFMPALEDCVRTAGDMGMYGQTFLLSLTAHHLGGIPQTMLGYYAETIREFLDVDRSLKMLFGISFGYPDPNSPASQYRIGKIPVAQSVTFHR